MEKIRQIIIIIIIPALIGVSAYFYFFAQKNQAGIDFTLEIPAIYTDALKIGAGEAGLLIRPLDASASALEQGAQENFYRDGYAHTDIRQVINNYSVKEDIILKAPGHPLEFRFAVQASGLFAQKDEQGNLDFYSSKNKAKEMNEPHPLDRVFTIPAAFLIDAEGIESSVADVAMEYADGILILRPDPVWLSAHKYPIILDPSIEISVLNLYSHPIQGDDWIVSFATYGTADLLIKPNDEATIADDAFVSLWCGDERRYPEIMPGDVIFYKDWQCAETGRVIHNTLQAGDHTLKFRFGSEIAYAYNHFSGDRRYAWGENIGWINASSTHETLTVADAGVTGYAWGENIGWIKFDYDGTPGATNTTATDWGVTNDGNGNLGGYAWGENIGWLNFNPTHSQAVIDRDSGDFTGYAWGENIGWVNFSHTLSNYVIRNLDTPAVNTLSVTSVGSKTVTVRGLAWRRGADITERGFKYGLTEADTWSASESGDFDSGEFALVLENLAVGTTYHIRAYAVNSEGTAYGEYIEFTTESGHTSSPIIFKRGVILNENIKLR